MGHDASTSDDTLSRLEFAPSEMTLDHLEKYSEEIQVDRFLGGFFHWVFKVE